MEWSRCSLALAVSLAAMAPTGAFRSQQATATQPPQPDARLRVSTACAAARETAAARIPELVSMLNDERRVENDACTERWWGGSFGVDPIVCLTTPAQEAARALARIGAAATGPLLAALVDPSSIVRRHAAVALGMADAAEAATLTPRLITALDDQEPDVRRAVVWALGERGDGSVVRPISTRLARDADVRVRATAAHALGELDDATAIDALVGALGDSDAEVRAMAAWALGEIESPRAVQGLVKALGDADHRPREKAAWALGEIQSVDAVPGLVKGLADAHPRVREMVAWALGEIGSATAVDGLITALRDGVAQVRAKAAWALGEIGDRRAAEALTASMKDSHKDVRKMAAWALAETLGQ